MSSMMMMNSCGRFSVQLKTHLFKQAYMIWELQCDSKKPLWFSDIFFQTVGNF